MAFAQRFPEEFDGIIAGDPGFSLPRAAVAEAWDTQAFARLVAPAGAKSFDPKLLPTSFSNAQFQVAREAVLAACDADDGVKDGITAAFESCTWRRVAPELKRRICSTTKADSCLSEAQIDALAPGLRWSERQQRQIALLRLASRRGHRKRRLAYLEDRSCNGRFPRYQCRHGRARARGDIHHAADGSGGKSDSSARL